MKVEKKIYLIISFFFIVFASSLLYGLYVSSSTISGISGVLMTLSLSPLLYVEVLKRRKQEVEDEQRKS